MAWSPAKCTMQSPFHLALVQGIACLSPRTHAPQNETCHQGNPKNTSYVNISRTSLLWVGKQPLVEISQYKRKYHKRKKINRTFNLSWNKVSIGKRNHSPGVNIQEKVRGENGENGNSYTDRNRCNRYTLPR